MLQRDSDRTTPCRHAAPLRLTMRPKNESPHLRGLYYWHTGQSTHTTYRIRGGPAAKWRISAGDRRPEHPTREQTRRWRAAEPGPRRTAPREKRRRRTGEHPAERAAADTADTPLSHWPRTRGKPRRGPGPYPEIPPHHLEIPTASAREHPDRTDGAHIESKTT